MKFDFNRRQASFGVFNNRRERHGPDEKVKAIDLPVRHPIKPKELDMLAPTNGVKLSTFLFGDNLRKPELQTHLLSPLAIHRKPEHISVTIFDTPTDKRRGMTFKDAKVKDPHVVIDEGGVPFVEYKFQFEPGEHLQRLSDRVECQTLEFECYAEAPELFDKPDDDGEEGGQTVMDTGKPETGKEGEDDEDDDDE